MAPTEVLARQHARFLERSLAASKVRIGLLTGSISPARRRKLLEEISEGKIDLIVGTHAVIHAVARSEARFAKLGLVVIDEQHKFGVRERAALRQAGLEPHYLVMTATPIPRSLCLTQFGDLDLTVMSELPPGRRKVVTSRVPLGPARARRGGARRRRGARDRGADPPPPPLRGRGTPPLRPPPRGGGVRLVPRRPLARRRPRPRRRRLELGRTLLIHRQALPGNRRPDRGLRRNPSPSGSRSPWFPVRATQAPVSGRGGRPARRRAWRVWSGSTSGRLP